MKLLQSILLLTFLVLSIHAKDLNAQPQPDAGKISQAEQEASQKAQSLNTKLLDIVGKLDDQSKKHFFLIYHNHNLISTVKTVRADVSNAIEACSKKNPMMETSLKKRFTAWNNAVSEQLSTAEAYRDNMIIAQAYHDPGAIKNLLSDADTLRGETNQRMEKIPVTSKEACEYLLNKMDETQETMSALLQSTLVNLPQKIQNFSDDDNSNATETNE